MHIYKFPMPLIRTGCDNRLDTVPMLKGNEILCIDDLPAETYFTQLIEQKGRPRLILTDGILSGDSNYFADIPCFPTAAEGIKTARYFKEIDFSDHTTLETKYCFNFMINRVQTSRQIFLKLIDLGQYENFIYTWSGRKTVFDMSHVIEEMNALTANHPINDPNFRKGMLEQVRLPTKFHFQVTGTIPDQANPTRYKFSGTHKDTWNQFIKDIFLYSAISLITECDNHAKVSFITEKSLYAFLGLTFPIWIGNYGQAHVLQQIGFDVFEDIIDHSYQWYPSLIERCYWALELNKELLMDFEKTKLLRQQCHARLISNREFTLGKGMLDWSRSIIDSMPKDCQDAAGYMLETWLQEPSENNIRSITNH